MLDIIPRFKIIINLSVRGKTSPKVIGLCARHRVQDMRHQYRFAQYLGSLEGRYPAMLKKVMDHRPSTVRTALFHTGLDELPDV